MEGISEPENMTDACSKFSYYVRLDRLQQLNLHISTTAAPPPTQLRCDMFT